MGLSDTEAVEPQPKESPEGGSSANGVPPADDAPPVDDAQAAEAPPTEAPSADAPPAEAITEHRAPDRAEPALGQPPGPIVASDPRSVAGRKAMWVHLDRLLQRQPALRDPERPDDLRKYRVAIRRLRAAVRMFADAYPGREVKPIRRGLADLADAVGLVRDLDHRMAHLNQWALERSDASRDNILPLLAAWGDERGRALAALHERIETRRHRRLVLALVEFVDQPSTTGRPTRFAGPSTVGDRLASSLWAAYEEVRAFAPVVRWADLETLHDLRIATKRFRDDIDFLADVLGPERAWLLARLVSLQDHLGALNDAAVAASGVRLFLEERHAQLAALEQAEIAAYLADREREIGRLRRTTPQRWRPVAGVFFARRLSRIVVIPAGVA